MPGSADAVKAYRVGLDAARTRLSSGLRRQFEGLSTDDLDDSFAEFIGRNEDVIAGGKQTAQTMTTTFLETLADARGVPFNPLPELEELATRTPSGSIRNSLDAVPSMVKAAIGEGRPIEEAMQYGGSLVERFVDDEMTRTADEEMKRQEQATELIVGWEGIVQPGACDGCQDNEGEHSLDEEMYRHPGCDCERVPVFGEGTEEAALETSEPLDIREAQDRLFDIDVQVDFAGMDPELVRPVTEALEQLHGDYPQVFEAVKTSVTFSDYIDPRAYASTGTGMYSGMQRAGLAAGQADIQINAALFKDKAALLEKLADDHKAGWLGGDTTKYVLDHEFGHILDQALGDGRSAFSEGDWSVLAPNSPTLYAKSDGKERFAEIFAMLRNGADLSGPDVDAVRELMK